MKSTAFAPTSPACNIEIFECRDCGKRFMKPSYTFTFTYWTPICPQCGSRRVEPLTMVLARKIINKVFKRQPKAE